MMTVPVPMRFRTDAAGGNGPVRVDPGRGHPHHYPVAAAIRRHGKGTAAITYAFTDTPSAGSRYRLPPWPIPLEPETTGGARIVIDSAAEGLQNYFQATVKLMQVMARACGHDTLSGFERRDLTTWKKDVAELTGVAYAGVDS